MFVFVWACASVNGRSELQKFSSTADLYALLYVLLLWIFSFSIVDIHDQCVCMFVCLFGGM